MKNEQSVGQSRSGFQGDCLPVLIGSLPLRDHHKATELILGHTPRIPLWSQLPALEGEDMLSQFLPGMPGWVHRDGKEYIDTQAKDFDADLLGFYERYMEILEHGFAPEEERFALGQDRAAGFYRLLDALAGQELPLAAVKGQVSGPITFGTGVKDQDGRSIFYDHQLRDALLKLLGLKAAWQAEQLARFQVPVIIFFDEPALAGFGSSELISISRQDVISSLNEAMEPVHSRQGLTGIHVCANADWSVILETETDILSFDAYAYFDKLIMYAGELRAFVDRGGVIAWGIVPTQDPEAIDQASAASLLEQLEPEFKQVEALGISRRQLLKQSLITPSCGTGSLSEARAEKVLALTREVSDQLRSAQ